MVTSVTMIVKYGKFISFFITQIYTHIKKRKKSVRLTSTGKNFESIP